MAAVSAIESPSQPRPLVIHRTLTGSRSEASARRAGPAGRPRVTAVRPAMAARGDQLRGRRTSSSRCSSRLPCRCRSPVAARHQPGVRQARQRMRDRWPLGCGELTEQAVGERQRQPDSGRLDAPPAAGEMPQQQVQPHLQPRLGGDRPHHVDIGGAAARAAHHRLADLWPGPDPVSELRVEQRQARRTQDLPGAQALEKLVDPPGRRLEQIAGADQLGRGPISDPHLERQHALENEQAHPAACDVEPVGQVALADARPRAA